MIKTRNISGVYKITNLINGKFYIGSAKDIDNRWYEHKFQLKNQVHVNLHLQRAYNKYKKEAFLFEILEQCPEKDLLEREQYYLDVLRPFKTKGYNICEHACGGDNITNHPRRNEIISQMAETQHQRYVSMTPKEREIYLERMRGKNHPCYGKKYTIERRRFQSQTAKKMWSGEKGKLLKTKAADLQRSRKGRKHSEETKEKMRLKRKLRVMPRRTAEEKLKISQSLKKYYASIRCK